MTIEEIFSNISSHMIKGMMVHEQMTNYYRFLGLNGYSQCHEYHFMKETCGYRKLQRYYISHYNKLITESDFDNPAVIPDSWYNYTRQDVDAATIKSAVKSGLTAWIGWEAETKDLYERMYCELLDIGEISTALFLADYIKDVDEEHKKAQGYMLSKVANGFDMTAIIEEQHRTHKKYKKFFEKSIDI